VQQFCQFHNSKENFISIWNNGRGIPVEMHREENVYVPAMIFGQLLTSSNYDDDEKKVTGGRNGYGAKLCNIFSTEFTVETSSKESGRMFKQVSYSCFTGFYCLICEFKVLIEVLDTHTPSFWSCLSVYKLGIFLSL